jgi:putative ABC transport system permease protein
MDILPILAALRRHRTAAALIVLEIALTCAIVSNAIFLIGERLSRMQRPTGIVEGELVRIEVTGGSRTDDQRASTRHDLAVLEAVPGVRKVASTRQLPFGNKIAHNNFVNLAPDQMHASLNAAVYLGSEGLFETLGVQLTAGRYFAPDEYVDEEARDPMSMGSTIVTRAVSERLWPGQSGLGQTLYLGSKPLRVVGVLERLVRPSDFFHGPSNYELSMVVPVRPRYQPVDNYVLRVDPERRAEVLHAAAAALEQNSRGRIILEKQTLEEMRAEHYRPDRAMAWLLVSVCAALLIITALGIVGLASFWVQQRTRQIGIRRALGATRGQILRYFQVENFLLATFGIALGMVLAYGINSLLMERYELGRLPAQFLPIGAVSLWLLGQLAVLGPALRAASVPPAVATRTV